MTRRQLFRLAQRCANRVIRFFQELPERLAPFSAASIGLMPSDPDTMVQYNATIPTPTDFPLT